ncbi:transcription factor of the MADS box [Mortierella polycephala]|uniref:Transcription factor of the MADS box n=1 Tax=Mortierella polycephala TaxID=41804 RepID=A0A9P6QAR0_9FUNG|nr:transcription factor of the MADS box [Mortierella polycephala]
MSATKRNQAQAVNAENGGEPSHHDREEHVDKKFKQVHGDGDEDDEDEDEEEAPKSGKRAGRRKIKIEYIEDKSRRHITFSKRKSGIMKKAFELSTLTGTQVLLLVVSETGLVYTFTTPKLQPLVTKAEGKNLIQACLHAPDKDSSPDNNDSAEQQQSRDGTPVDHDDHQATTPQGSSQAQVPSAQASPQQQQQQHPQQQQQQPYPPQQQQASQGQPAGGYGSSSAMNVPSYPPPYSHIPFPAQYNYPNMGMHYQNAPNAPPPQSYGGNQYWSPPPQQQPTVSGPTSQPAVQQTKGGRGDN